jgi:hypothetical protein
MRNVTLNFPEVDTESFVPDGGLDLVSPLLLLKPGVAFAAKNYELNVKAGVSRIGGYDTYVDGPTPSEMDFRLATINVTSGTLVSGDYVRGATSLATARFAVASDGLDSPERLKSSSQRPVYLTDVVGRFVAGEPLTHVDTTPAAVMTLVTAPEFLLPDGTDRERALARAEAEDAMRAVMDKPGSGLFSLVRGELRPATGPVLAVFFLNDQPYVIRQKNEHRNEGLFCCILKPKTEVNGRSNREWEQVYGGWGQNLLPSPNARFEVVTSNIGDPAGPKAAWGVSGTGKAFKFDGTTLTQITTGMAVDTPSHIAIHVNRVFLSFGGSIQYSPIGDPLGTWTVLTGAAEIAVGDEITGLFSLRGESERSALLISTRERLWVLYGNSQDEFQLVPFSDSTGALEGTFARLTQPIFQNAFGLTSLSATQRFGGFEDSIFSDAIKPFINARRGSANCAMACRNKNQYRLFFDDGTAVYATFRGAQFAGLFTQRFRHTVTACVSHVMADNTELMLVGTEDGSLFKLDAGRTFAGKPIDHYVRFAFNHIGSPRMQKHFLRAVVEVQASGFMDVLAGYDLDYGGVSRDVTEEETLTSDYAGGTWDVGNWDVGYWDAATSEPMTVDTPGSGVNFSLRLRGEDRITDPFTIPAVLIDYVRRKKRRGT